MTPFCITVGMQYHQDRHQHYGGLIIPPKHPQQNNVSTVPSKHLQMSHRFVGTTKIPSTTVMRLQYHDQNHQYHSGPAVRTTPINITLGLKCRLKTHPHHSWPIVPQYHPPTLWWLCSATVIPASFTFGLHNYHDIHHHHQHPPESHWVYNTITKSATSHLIYSTPTGVLHWIYKTHQCHAALTVSLNTHQQQTGSAATK